jgi:hypothetical protein
VFWLSPLARLPESCFCFGGGSKTVEESKVKNFIGVGAGSVSADL